MTELELEQAARLIAEKIEAGGGFEEVKYIEEEGQLEGEPASITIEFDGGRQFVLGVLPL